jgi:hypothetical protein
VVVSRSLELLETMAGQVSAATGEALDVSRPAEGAESDPGYRVQLMSFIVGSLSRAAQAFRSEAAEPEPLPEAAEEAEDEAVAEEPVVGPALPTQPTEEAEQVEAAPELFPSATQQEPTGYGSKGQPMQQRSTDSTLDTKA